MIVALRAGERRAEPDHRSRVRPIDQVLVARLVGIGAALLVRHRIAMEAAGDLLCRGRVRQHVAGDLFDREPIERHVAVQRVDDPVAVLPDAAAIVLLVAIGVRVAGEIEPRPRPPLAEVRRGQQSIDGAVVRVVGGVRDEGIEFGRRRGKSGQVQRHAPQQCRLVRLARRRQLLAFEARAHEPVNRIARPHRIRNGGRCRTGRLDIRPVVLDGGVGGRLCRIRRRQNRALIDPGLKQRDGGRR